MNRHPGYYEKPALTIELKARKGRPEQESNLYQAGRSRRFCPLNYRVKLAERAGFEPAKPILGLPV